MSTALHLRQRLAARYLELRRSLERMVGSRDRAADALHETWVRLESASPASPVRNPDAYLLRMASNIATDGWRKFEERVSDDERGMLLQLPDEGADPARIVAARRDLHTLQRALDSLPPRRRAILAAARIEGLLNAEIAQRFGISVPMVKKELQAAMRQCRASMADTEAVTRGDLTGRRKF
ncbi:Extracytoplasmic function (ECF) sigma factor VreI [plant metagenome]|uniref:Extracytoplasmic function (ECF) sigma factor VreI n=1 Tax=plant metagenome TaxID=1297885 RepID=A0A484RU86_9ZZZZ